MKKPSQTHKNKKSSSKKTTKNVPWRGWKDVKPTYHGRTVMEEKCGKKCFLGPYKSFPICDMNTCKVDKRGIWAAYIRAKEWATRSKTLKKKNANYHVRHAYTKISRKAKQMLGVKHKGGLFGLFESNNPLIKLHVSPTFDPVQYEKNVTDYINSIFVNDGEEGNGGNNVNNVSNDVNEYFKKYNLSKTECKSTDNQKILITFKVINDIITKNINNDNDTILFLTKLFKANIEKTVESIEDNLSSFNVDCKSDNNKDYEEMRKMEEEKERERRKSELTQPKKSLFNKPRNNSASS